MSLPAFVIVGAFLYAVAKNNQSILNAVESPNSGKPMQKPDKYLPSLNDNIKPPSSTYDPMRIGDTSRANTNIVKGPYRSERRLGPEAAYWENALFRTPRAREYYSQSQTAYIPLDPLLDNHFKYKGVKPHPRIVDLGYPYDIVVPPYSQSPV